MIESFVGGIAFGIGFTVVVVLVAGVFSKTRF